MLFNPINKPPATMAGIIGTKISESIFTNRCTGFIFLADCALTSEVVDASFPVNFSSSLNTLLTVPDPIIIWYCPPVENVPLTTSILFSASSFTKLSSFKTNRSLVAQCAIASKFSSPPIAFKISSADCL
ncbi:Uncharacterised protein [Staphylococcus aureus]|nr:Uncharacterised protein [Staphylococcus aureus]